MKIIYKTIIFLIYARAHCFYSKLKRYKYHDYFLRKTFNSNIVFVRSVKLWSFGVCPLRESIEIRTFQILSNVCYSSLFLIKPAVCAWRRHRATSKRFTRPRVRRSLVILLLNYLRYRHIALLIYRFTYRLQGPSVYQYNQWFVSKKYL